MISQIQIQNFKCFKDATTFDFSKLNLLTGINGRGKSSLLQSILLVSQSFNDFKKTKKLLINGQHISLGNFDDIKNSETPRGENIIFQFNIENLMYANLKFKENEDDELTALENGIDISANDTDVDKINSVLSTVIEKIKLEFKEELPEDDVAIIAEEIAFYHLIRRVHYISADRLGPVKYVEKTSFDDSDFVFVGSRGEYTINVLTKRNLPLVNDKLYIGNDAKSVIQQAEEWLGYILEGAKIKIEGLEKTSSVLWMLINNKSNPYNYKPINVGFGYSYILPLIVSGLIAQPGDILIVENPEAHLHPRAQSRIAEFFARVATCGIQVFIESHSEHILNGLRVSVLNPEIELSNDDMTIQYFNEDFDPQKLTLDDKGKINNWPNGFFDQQEIDLANIFKFSR